MLPRLFAQCTKLSVLLLLVLSLRLPFLLSAGDSGGLLNQSPPGCVGCVGGYGGHLAGRVRCA